ncbi:ABC transporter substrate-binding protein [Microbacterium excoecariae]|uniref:ABC transporter substrate-binding protein n=1 Tax=Microbacterium excoecariae TaxID=2715210 RepID=UPI001408A241|nr:ABC transporter substrate-binding protein [Microbacterium excoecariae]NHI16594.1 ABC transporter substrate-binding protein [Microbacterium excoecariae]
MRTTSRLAAGATLAATALVLASCGSSDPLASEGSSEGSGDTITVGSAAFAESEIIAYIYAGALERAGLDVSVSPAIGSREVYIAALEDGSVDLVPDYTGNLLQFFDDSVEAEGADAVYEALSDAVPEGYDVLEMAEAADADSYNVTREFSEEYGVTSLADLADLDMEIRVAANPELAERPYGIPGLKDVYGIDATLVPINDGGGPNTLQALLDGDVEMADIYSTTPSIAANDLVTLEDPEDMVLAQNVVPLISSDAASEEAVTAINAVQGALTTEDLIELNAQSSEDKMSSEDIAEGWLDESGLFD